VTAACTDSKRLRAEAAIDDFNPFNPPGGALTEEEARRLYPPEYRRRWLPGYPRRAPAEERDPPRPRTPPSSVATTPVAEGLRPSREEATEDAGASLATVDGPPSEATVDAGVLRALSVFDTEARRAAHAAGRPDPLSLSEFVTWKLRSAVEAGEFAPAKVDTVALPEDADDVVQAVWGGFVYLLAVRWLKDAGEPTPFSRKFAAAWCGVTERQARHAIYELRRLGYLVKVGEEGPANRRMYLYLPKAAR
jgi:hypothetical protein